MKCYNCKKDINQKGQDNVSPFSDFPICEDRSSEMTKEEWKEIEGKYEKDSD